MESLGGEEDKREEREERRIRVETRERERSERREKKEKKEKKERRAAREARLEARLGKPEGKEPEKGRVHSLQGESLRPSSSPPPPPRRVPIWERASHWEEERKAALKSTPPQETLTLSLTLTRIGRRLSSRNRR